MYGLDREAVLRPGLDVTVLDLSPRGALLEGASSCRPGTCTELTVALADGRRRVARCRILRSAVVALAPLRFHYAVAFDTALDLDG